LAAMVVTSGCPSRINRHSADWIDRHTSPRNRLVASQPDDLDYVHRRTIASSCAL
jgi:hypothetical protein